MCISCVTGQRVFRLRLASGTHVYVEWHRYLGPAFFRDRKCTREIEQWYEQPEICEALEWFQARGKVA